MAEPPEFWVFALVNMMVFLLGSLLTALSYLAYRSRPVATSFRTSTVGFALITVGGLVEPMYQLGIRGDYELTGREMLTMQGIEGILMALGLGMLFYSIKGYNRTRIVEAGVGTDPNDSSR